MCVGYAAITLLRYHVEFFAWETWFSVFILAVVTRFGIYARQGIFRWGVRRYGVTEKFVVSRLLPLQVQFVSTPGIVEKSNRQGAFPFYPVRRDELLRVYPVPHVT